MSGSLGKGLGLNPAAEILVAAEEAAVAELRRQVPRENKMIVEISGSRSPPSKFLVTMEGNQTYYRGV